MTSEKQSNGGRIEVEILVVTNASVKLSRKSEEILLWADFLAMVVI